ncbi:MAG TPA: peptide deformylase [Candidatus Sumerlaeota bacterium]|nr:peptide deformylase [Candidatus Sumerlaeota bacterium]
MPDTKKKLKIRTYGDPVLREKAKAMKRTDVTDSFREFVLSMGETMYDANGVGLAATQVGDLRRFFVADVAQVVGDEKKKRRKDPARRELIAYINPEIIESSAEDEEYLEGCLSIPEVDAEVYRPSRIRIRYRDLDWNENELWAEGLLARVYQHELDHLDGVLFIDRIGDAARSKIAGKLSSIKKRTDDERNGR